MRYLVTMALLLALVLVACSTLSLDRAGPTPEADQTAGSPVASTEPTNTAAPPTTAAPAATATALPVTEEPTEAGSSIINWMMADAAIRTDTPPTAILLKSIENVEWPSAAMGCPAPDRDYAQVVTPGLQVTLLVRGEDYVYHADEQDNFVLCRNGRPQAPVEDFAEIWG